MLVFCSLISDIKIANFLTKCYSKVTVTRKSLNKYMIKIMD